MKDANNKESAYENHLIGRLGKQTRRHCVGERRDKLAECG